MSCILWHSGILGLCISRREYSDPRHLLLSLTASSSSGLPEECWFLEKVSFLSGEEGVLKQLLQVTRSVPISEIPCLSGVVTVTVTVTVWGDS